MNDEAEINAIKDFFALSYFEYYPNATQEQFEKECNSIVCYNEKVKIDASKLAFFPYDPDMPHVEAKEEDSEEEKEEYNPWSRENYSYEEAMYDALGGEMEAIWNID